MTNHATTPAPIAMTELPQKSWLDAPHDIANEHANAWAKGWNEARAALQQRPAPAMPEGWEALSIIYNGDMTQPEEVAYGPPHMMRRLGKWLDKFMASEIAQQAAAAPAPADDLWLSDLERKSLNRILKAAGVCALAESSNGSAMAAFWSLAGTIANMLESHAAPAVALPAAPELPPLQPLPKASDTLHLLSGATIASRERYTAEQLQDYAREYGKACAITASRAMPALDEPSKGDALWQAINRACGDLPEGYEVRIELENGAGGVVWYDDEANRHVIDGEGYLSDDIDEAVRAALDAAQQDKDATSQEGEA